MTLFDQPRSRLQCVTLDDEILGTSSRSARPDTSYGTDSYDKTMMPRNLFLRTHTRVLLYGSLSDRISLDRSLIGCYGYWTRDGRVQWLGGVIRDIA